jgi:tetratricopeptide (TPR) repeat protein
VTRRAPLLAALLAALSVAPVALAAQDGSVAAALAAGDSAWDSQRFPEARTAYTSALARDSVASSRAVFRLATLLAWDNRFDESVSLFRRYRRLEPGDRLGALGLARTLAWQSRFGASLLVLDTLLLASPNDKDARLLQATVFAWDGRLGEAEARFRALAASGSAPEAEAGLARVSAWRGDLARSAAQWRAILAQRPADVDALVGLAQVERWMGRPASARTALDAALRLDPDNGDAQQLSAWVRADLASGGGPQYLLTDDSDGNRVQTVGLAASRAAPIWTGTWSGAVHWRTAELPTTSGVRRASSLAARSVATWTPNGGRTTLRAELGFARLTDAVPGASVSRFAPIVSLRAARQLSTDVTVGLTASSLPFDETAPLIARGIRTHAIEADGAWTLPARWSLLGSLELARVSGDTGNSRLAGTAALRWTPRRGTWAGVGVRHLAYDQFVRLGYFAPQQFTSAELQAHFELPKDLGWNVFADAGLGEQRIQLRSDPADSRGTQRASLGVLWRPAPGQEVSAGLMIANVASPFAQDAAARYRAGSFQLRARLLVR